MSLAIWLIKLFCSKYLGSMFFLFVYILLGSPTFKANKELFPPIRLRPPRNHDIITTWVCTICKHIIVLKVIIQLLFLASPFSDLLFCLTQIVYHLDYFRGKLYGSPERSLISPLCKSPKHGPNQALQ